MCSVRDQICVAVLPFLLHYFSGCLKVKNKASIQVTSCYLYKGKENTSLKRYVYVHCTIICNNSKQPKYFMETT